MAHHIPQAVRSFYGTAQILGFVKLTDSRVHSPMVAHQLINRTRKGARLMKAARQILLVCFSAGFGLSLLSCAGPMNDPAGKRVYDEWVAQTGWRNPPADAAYAETQATDSYVFRMKAVKDYEYGNYVTNLRRGTSWGEFATDSIKITLDSLIAVTGSAGTKAALGAASAGVTGATSSIKKNVLFDQSITTFITKMDTLRLNKWNEILLKWKG